jgi:hypothetical protein
VARSSPQPRRKKRTREHVIADLSLNYVERRVLLCGHTLEEMRHDYGLDLAMYTYSAEGLVEPGLVHFQVKATDRLELRSGGEQVALRVAWRDLEHWAIETAPVILVLYDAPSDIAYWVYVQAHVRRHQLLDRRKAGAATTTLSWPRTDVLDVEAVQRIAGFKAAVVRQTGGVIHSYDD